MSISFLFYKGKKAKNVVMEISNPSLNDISLDVKILKEKLPNSFGTASLFIEGVQSSDYIENMIDPEFGLQPARTIIEQ